MGPPANAFTSARVRDYARLVFGMLFLLSLVLFIVQNSPGVQVRFMLWDVEMSQALVVLMSLLLGVALGVGACSWRGWRRSHRPDQG